MSERRPLIHRLKAVAHSQFPHNFSHPDAAGRLEIYRQLDPEHNARTTPPADEFIDIPALWAVEFYTPAQVRTLLVDLKRLGWDDPDRHRCFDETDRW